MVPLDQKVVNGEEPKFEEQHSCKHASTGRMLSDVRTGFVEIGLLKVSVICILWSSKDRQTKCDSQTFKLQSEKHLVNFKLLLKHR